MAAEGERDGSMATNSRRKEGFTPFHLVFDLGLYTGIFRNISIPNSTSSSFFSDPARLPVNNFEFSSIG
jgi:hypothetical protein